MLELHDLRPDWESDWAGTVAAHPSATLFHHPDWLKVLQRTQHLDLVPLGVTRNGRMIGLLPLLVRRYGPLRIRASPFIVEDTPYLGPVVDGAPLREVLEALERWARHNRLAFVRLLLPPGTLGAVDASMNGSASADFVEKHTHILDLRAGADRVWRNLKDGCRGAIKKAQRAGLQITSATTPSEIHEYYRIADALHRAQQLRHPNSEQFFQEVWTRFGSSKEVSLLLCRHEGRLVGGVFLGHSRGTAYYLDGASNHDGKRLQAANLLLWEAIRQAIDGGFDWFDFVGSDIPRLAQFKASFGGDLHSYWCVEVAYSRPARILRRGYPRWKAWVARWSA